MVSLNAHGESGQATFLNYAFAKPTFIEGVKMNARRSHFKQAPDLPDCKFEAGFTNCLRAALCVCSLKLELKISRNIVPAEGEDAF